MGPATGEAGRGRKGTDTKTESRRDKARESNNRVEEGRKGGRGGSV